MKILITGGTGAIGQAVINKLLENHTNHVFITTRNVERAKKQLGNRVSVAFTPAEIDINNIDVVINLAGEPIADKRWTTAQKECICQSRWQITATLADLISQADNPPHTFISGSAIGIYGRQTEQVITEEFSDFYQEFSHHICSQWEKLALSAASNKTRVCLLRTGIVLNKDAGALKKMLPAFSMGLGGPMASGNQVMSWIDIQDMVNGILFIIKTAAITGPINMTAPNPVTNSQFTRTLAKTLHRPSFLPMPAFVLKLMFGEMADLLIYGQHVIPKKMLDAGFTFSHPELSSSLKAQLNN